jgi:hypothetical protein
MVISVNETLLPLGLGSSGTSYRVVRKMGTDVSEESPFRILWLEDGRSSFLRKVGTRLTKAHGGRLRNIIIFNSTLSTESRVSHACNHSDV